LDCLKEEDVLVAFSTDMKLEAELVTGEDEEQEVEVTASAGAMTSSRIASPARGATKDEKPLLIGSSSLAASLS